MTIKFRKIQTTSKFLDSRKDYEEKASSLEYRIDPLTKDMGLVRDLRFKNPLKTDLSPLIAKSLERGCPFCKGKINTVTPKFVPDLCPDGRITVGEATVFPNAAPYMQYSAVTVICSSHFCGLSEFSPPILSDALKACQDYGREKLLDPGTSYPKRSIATYGYLRCGQCDSPWRHPDVYKKPRIYL